MRKNEKGHNSKNEEETVLKIKESLDFLDYSVNVGKPDLMELVELVNRTEEKRERGKNRQFIRFILVALLIITVETYSFYRSFAFFTAVQAAALLCVIPAVVLRARHKNRQVS